MIRDFAVVRCRQMSASSLFSRLPLFGDVSPDALARLEHRMRRREFAPRSVIVREGSADDSAFIILSGRVAVRRKDPDSGIEFLLAELGTGQMFGEMALLTGKPRTASVVARRSDDVRASSSAPTSISRCASIPPHCARAAGGARRSPRARKPPRRHRLCQPVARQDRSARADAAAARRSSMSTSVVPIAFCNNRLTLAMTNPNNIVAFDDVRRVIKGVMIEPAVVTEEDFQRFMTDDLRRAVAQDGDRGGAADPAGSPAPRPPAPSRSASDGRPAAVGPHPRAAARPPTPSATKRRDQAGPDERVRRCADHQAGELDPRPGDQAGQRATSTSSRWKADVTLRFRIDGVLQVVQRLPKRVQLGLISRLKILSRLDIAEKRLPQDGRISVTHGRQADRLPRVDRARQVGREGRACASSTRATRARARQADLAHAGG